VLHAGCPDLSCLPRHNATAYGLAGWHTSVLNQRRPRSAISPDCNVTLASFYGTNLHLSCSFPEHMLSLLSLELQTRGDLTPNGTPSVPRPIDRRGQFTPPNQNSNSTPKSRTSRRQYGASSVQPYMSRQIHCDAIFTQKLTRSTP